MVLTNDVSTACNFDKYQKEKYLCFKAQNKAHFRLGFTSFQVTFLVDFTYFFLAAAGSVNC